MDCEKIIDALIVIRDICNNNVCPACPFMINNNECGIESSEPDEWNINSFENWRAFK